MTSAPQPLSAPVSLPPSPGARWKNRRAESRDALQQRYLETDSASELLRCHRQLVDSQLKAVWQYLEMPAGIALVAVGGYGRGQLFPYSDIDLLVLLPHASDDELQRKLERFIGMLWDIGLEVGPSVRNVDECVALAAQGVTVPTSLPAA